MSEDDAVALGILTQADIEARLAELGLADGTTVLVHTSMSALGWVCGGPIAVIQALLDVVGKTGTVMMPTFTGHLSDPSGWESPGVPKAWWSVIRATMPAFDPVTTPTRDMGAVSECFRNFPGVMRSSHPSVSFAAHGPNAEFLLDDHDLNFGLGERSPLARLYDKGGSVLLLGVNHQNNSSLHLAEYRWQHIDDTQYRAGAPVLVGGKRKWIEYDDVDNKPDDFPRIGKAFERQFPVATHQIGAGTAKLMLQANLVDFGVSWMDRHRPQPDYSANMPPKIRNT